MLLSSRKITEIWIAFLQIQGISTFEGILRNSKEFLISSEEVYKMALASQWDSQCVSWVISYKGDPIASASWEVWVTHSSLTSFIRVAMQMWTRSCEINSSNVSESEALETLVHVCRMQSWSAPLHWFGAHNLSLSFPGMRVSISHLLECWGKDSCDFSTGSIPLSK